MKKLVKILSYTGVIGLFSAAIWMPLLIWLVTSLNLPSKLVLIPIPGLFILWAIVEILDEQLIGKELKEKLRNNPELWEKIRNDPEFIERLKRDIKASS